jgi:16S rRNA (guanine966-N2)-methyltransferase
LASPRIIAGSARGLRLKSVPGDTTRPITDRVKESLFDILGGDVIESSFLDVFGGTGSVGIEALSRGAVYARFLDKSRTAVITIKSNLEHTHLQGSATVQIADAFAYLNRPPDRSFDYIYIAPPQYKDMWKQAMAIIDNNTGWFSDESWLIVQIDPLEYSLLDLKHLKEFDQRKYGSTLLVFYAPITSE